MSPSRDPVLDVVKGLGILLIAFWHSALKADFPTLHQLQRVFAVPLFFFVSGAVLHLRSGALLDFARKRAVSLLLPYALTLALVAAVTAVSNKFGTVFSVVMASLSGRGESMPQGFAPLWFLPCLFLALLVAGPIARNLDRASDGTARPAIRTMVALGVVWMLGEMLSAHGRPGGAEAGGLPWSLDLVPFAVCWLLIGRWMYPSFGPWVSGWRVGLIAGLAWWMLVTRAGADMDLNLGLYGPPLATTLACLCGIVMILSVARLACSIGWMSGILQHIGHHTLPILCFHLILGSFANAKLQKALEGGPVPGVAIATACWILSVVAAMLVGRLLGRLPVFNLAFGSGVRRRTSTP